MLPLLLLAVLAGAHAGDAPSHTDPETAPDRTPSLGDLDVESELARLGITADEAVRMSATWTDPIAPPARAVAEGRTRGWTMDETTVRVRREHLRSGEVLSDTEAPGRRPGGTRCATLEGVMGAEVELAPIDPRGRERGLADQPERTRLAVTYVEDQSERTALVHLQPGESVTVVELVPDPDARPRRRARDRRRLSLAREDADLEVTEQDDVTEVCVTPHPRPPRAEVVKERPERPLPPPLSADPAVSDAEASGPEDPPPGEGGPE
jgi:hypothetical protein